MKHLLNDYPAVHPDGDINVVVEVPAGSITKYEVNKETGRMDVELVDGEPRQVNYLGYPGNYGMVPRTLLPKEQGGDGDPLDVLVLGPSSSSGEVLRCKVIGVLKLLDRGEQDDKLIAVQEGGPFYGIEDLSQLRQEFPGVLEIIETWFVNYKGAGEMEGQGYHGKDTAVGLLEMAVRAFKAQ